MAHINRKYIDRHWSVFIIRGVLAFIFGLCTLLYGNLENNRQMVFSCLCVYLLSMGIIDSASALYNSTKKHGWVNSIIDAGVDIIAALVLIFFANNEAVFQLIVLAVYVCISGLIDVFHGFISTTDPTDRFIRILVGVCGCVMGFVILNAGGFNETNTAFIRFFGAYTVVVGVTSLIYGVHNRAQITEDSTARKEAAKKATKARVASKNSK